MSDTMTVSRERLEGLLDAAATSFGDTIAAVATKAELEAISRTLVAAASEEERDAAAAALDVVTDRVGQLAEFYGLTEAVNDRPLTRVATELRRRQDQDVATTVVSRPGAGR